MVATNSRTEVNEPRRMTCRVMIGTKRADRAEIRLLGGQSSGSMLG
jgi:hypothetical protein